MKGVKKMEKMLKILKEKWKKSLEVSIQKAEKTNVPTIEAFENGFTTAARAIVTDLDLLEAICTDSK